MLLVNQKPFNEKMFVNTLPPLGILSIAAYLESKGMIVDVVDCFVDDFSSIELSRHTHIGFSINISNVESSLQSIQSIKRRYPNSEIIVGGPLPSSMPEIFIQQSAIDIVVVGEGEKTIYELMTADVRDSVKGLYLKDDAEGFRFTGNRPWIDDLDALPFPALKKVPLQRYRVPISKGRPVSSLMSSRGCPFGCTFCYKSMGNRWRARSAENVAQEIEWQVKVLGVKEICISDDNFTFNLQRAEKIFDIINRKKIEVHLQFINGLRADSLSDSLLRKMKQGGCWLIGLAPESGNPDTLKKVGKKFDLYQVQKARDLCFKHGITTYSFFMIGFPWETAVDVKKTIRFALELDTEIVQFSRITPLPGTALFKQYCMEDSKINYLTEKSLFHGKLFPTAQAVESFELEKLIKSAYRQYYLRPRKALDLIRTMSVIDLLRLFLFSFKTKNI